VLRAVRHAPSPLSGHAPPQASRPAVWLGLAVRPQREGCDSAGGSEDDLQAGDRGPWIFHAELAAREAGKLTLAEAPELVCLYTDEEPAKFERAALQWHARFVTESGSSLLQAQIALAALAELRGGNDAARRLLAELADSH
jgi:hypothetical protein